MKFCFLLGNLWWNLDLTLWPRVKGSERSMGKTYLGSSSESISRDDYGLCVVGQPRHDQERLLWACEDRNWQHFCVTNKKSTQSNQGQTASQADVRCAADAGQRLSQNSDVISRVWLWNAFTSLLFSRLSTLGLLLASENEIWTTTEVIWKQQWRHGGCWRLLRGACFSLIFLKDRKTRISLANVYWCQGKLSWKITGS